MERTPKSGLQKQSDTKLSSLQVLCNDDSIDDIAENDYDTTKSHLASQVDACKHDVLGVVVKAAECQIEAFEEQQ